MRSLILGLMLMFTSVILLDCDKDGGPTEPPIPAEPPIPERVYVESIRIYQIPFSDNSGAGWDLLSGPDVYPNLVTSSDIIVTFRSSFMLDVAPSDLPLQWSLIPFFEVSNWTTAYFVAIWDYDELGDDYIGASAGFRINDIIATEGYVTTVARQNSSGTIRTVITLRWQ